MPYSVCLIFFNDLYLLNLTHVSSAGIRDFLFKRRTAFLERKRNWTAGNMDADFVSRLALIYFIEGNGRISDTFSWMLILRISPPFFSV